VVVVTMMVMVDVMRLLFYVGKSVEAMKEMADGAGCSPIKVEIAMGEKNTRSR